MCTCQTAVAFFQTEYVVVSMVLFKQLDLLADVLKACQYFDLFYVICFCHDICHVCGNDRLNKCRIFRHGTCLCLFS